MGALTSARSGAVAPPARQVAVRRALDLAPVVLLALLLLIFAAIDVRVAAVDNLRNVLSQATPIALLALGAFIVLVTGGIDLSAGVAVAFCSVVMAGRLDTGVSLPLALGAGLLAMLGLGLLNGLLVGYLRIPPFVVTLATMAAVQGATLQVATKGVLLINQPALKDLGIGQFLGVPKAVLFAAGVATVTWAVMRFTRFGLRTYAIGSDAAAAALSGVLISRQQLLTYIAGSLFVFFTSVVMISRVPVVTPNLGGTSLLLDAIAAAVLGGTSIFGGRGTAGGVVVGAVTVSLLTNALRVFGVNPSSIDLFKGGIIIVALLADAGMRFARRRLDGSRLDGGYLS